MLALLISFFLHGTEGLVAPQATAENPAPGSQELRSSTAPLLPEGLHRVDTFFPQGTPLPSSDQNWHSGSDSDSGTSTPTMKAIQLWRGTTVFVLEECQEHGDDAPKAGLAAQVVASIHPPPKSTEKQIHLILAALNKIGLDRTSFQTIFDSLLNNGRLQSWMEETLDQLDVSCDASDCQERAIVIWRIKQEYDKQKALSTETLKFSNPSEHFKNFLVLSFLLGSLQEDCGEKSFLGCYRRTCLKEDSQVKKRLQELLGNMFKANKKIRTYSLLCKLMSLLTKSIVHETLHLNYLPERRIPAISHKDSIDRILQIIDKDKIPVVLMFKHYNATLPRTTITGRRVVDVSLTNTFVEHGFNLPEQLGNTAGLQVEICTFYLSTEKKKDLETRMLKQSELKNFLLEQANATQAPSTPAVADERSSKASFEQSCPAVEAGRRVSETIFEQGVQTSTGIPDSTPQEELSAGELDNAAFQRIIASRAPMVAIRHFLAVILAKVAETSSGEVATIEIK